VTAVNGTDSIDPRKPRHFGGTLVAGRLEIAASAVSSETAHARAERIPGATHTATVLARSADEARPSLERLLSSIAALSICDALSGMLSSTIGEEVTAAGAA